MHFRRDDGSSFSLAVVGYQFPAETTAEYDSNWLNIRIEVVEPRGKWSCTDPALLTYEVERLAQWLEKIAAGNPTSVSESFLEPNLSFELASPSAERLRVIFSLEFRPPWLSKLEADDDEYFVEFPVIAAELEAAAASLRAQLKRFPQRALR